MHLGRPAPEGGDSASWQAKEEYAWRFERRAFSGEEVLMLVIHPKARTTSAVRAEIARSTEPTGELSRHDGGKRSTRSPRSCASWCCG